MWVCAHHGTEHLAFDENERERMLEWNGSWMLPLRTCTRFPDPGASRCRPSKNDKYNEALSQLFFLPERERFLDRLKPAPFRLKIVSN